MKKKKAFISILFAITLTLLAANTVDAIGVTSTITIGNSTSYPIGFAYDSGKGEIFVTNPLSGTVSVISDESDASASPSPATPEISNTALILVASVVTFFALVLTVKRRKTFDWTRWKCCDVA